MEGFLILTLMLSLFITLSDFTASAVKNPFLPIIEDLYANNYCHGSNNLINACYL
jgi:hypothetical protein